MRTKFNLMFVSLFALLTGAYQGLVNAWVKNGQLGGYVHDTAMAQFIPPTMMHCVTGTWTWTAGAVSGTIAAHKAAAGETTVVTVPVTVPSNSVALKGSYVKSIEIDYNVGTADCTSCTFTLNKVTRTADTAALTVAAVTVTQDITAANAKTQGRHKVVVTLTTPVWLLNTEYLLLNLSFVCAAGTVLDMLGAVANFTERI